MVISLLQIFGFMCDYMNCSQFVIDLFTDGHNSSSNTSISSSKPISEQHKQVDELLASGFAKESCISRYQYSSYHKNKPYKPSSYLISKLRSYEELHTRCGPQSLSYRKIIRKLSSTQHIHDSETTPCKYLVWTPANGLGNRMVSMASAFLYFLLENRVFLVEFEADMDGLFCEPFPNSTWLLPKDFPHKNRWSRLPTFKNRANSGESGLSPSFVHLDIQNGHGDHNIRHFHCNETLVSLQKIPVLIIISDQYFAPSLFMSSSYKEELNKMFLEKDAVFHQLGHYLFSPSNEAWGLITRFYEAYLAKADEKIGLQIRVFDHQHIPSRNIMSQILSCTQSHNILPSLDNTKKSLEFPWQNTASKSKVVLVASLYPEYAERLKSMYWTRPTTNEDVIGVYQPSHEEYQKFGDNMHNMKALAEIYLLSLCDVLVTSPQSTFGYVAHSLGGLKPWIMVSLGKNKHSDPPCKRGISMEPCFHTPPQ
ncbi:galactoside 2-alpha-L-fucosyltransferase-like [Chenopodium quinoa]|uniref:galactoside 2-alpha-L-fucosyltransferase-like n=1 Tax=Chenopodium quinoa TaxID=63459 RepID=UPI000B798540|nr:galactoside 2-alpha-L-fucosyltransferase-like [Chenopodium quinoa]